MSWGLKIVVSLGVFMAGMIAMVFFVASLQIDLVEEDYYEEEIKYQDKIDVLTETNELGAPLSIKYTGKHISFDFPEQGTMPTGEIHFYRPSDASRDFNVSISADSDRNQLVDAAKLTPGAWKVKVTWFADNKKFFKQETIYIN